MGLMFTNVDRYPRCAECHGQGKCRTCFGTGVNIHLNSGSPDCETCYGTGSCPVCHGSGLLAPFDHTIQTLFGPNS